MHEGLPAGDYCPEALHLLELGQYPPDLSRRKFESLGWADVAVAAPEVAAAGDLKLQIPERRHR